MQLEDYGQKKAKARNRKMINQKKRELLQERLTKEALFRVGTELASLWGGKCTNAYIDSKNQCVFECIEHGEPFIVCRTLEEVTKIW